ncbi:unnamed protein product [Amoebophrya sp. A120]|nr:unnamed protein product [Amoebophrya sp. A120]|eukprot:GSA120T00001145001.1
MATSTPNVNARCQSRGSAFVTGAAGRATQMVPMMTRPTMLLQPSGHAQEEHDRLQDIAESEIDGINENAVASSSGGDNMVDVYHQAQHSAGGVNRIRNSVVEQVGISDSDAQVDESSSDEDSDEDDSSSGSGTSSDSEEGEAEEQNANCIGAEVKNLNLHNQPDDHDQHEKIYEHIHAGANTPEHNERPRSASPPPERTPDCPTILAAAQEEIDREMAAVEQEVAALVDQEFLMRETEQKLESPPELQPQVLLEPQVLGEGLMILAESGTAQQDGGGGNNIKTAGSSTTAAGDETRANGAAGASAAANAATNHLSTIMETSRLSQSESGTPASSTVKALAARFEARNPQTTALVRGPSSTASGVSAATVGASEAGMNNNARGPPRGAAAIIQPHSKPGATIPNTSDVKTPVVPPRTVGGRATTPEVKGRKPSPSIRTLTNFFGREKDSPLTSGRKVEPSTSAATAPVAVQDEEQLGGGQIATSSLSFEQRHKAGTNNLGAGGGGVSQHSTAQQGRPGEENHNRLQEEHQINGAPAPASKHQAEINNGTTTDGRFVARHAGPLLNSRPANNNRTMNFPNFLLSPRTFNLPNFVAAAAAPGGCATSTAPVVAQGDDTTSGFHAGTRPHDQPFPRRTSAAPRSQSQGNSKSTSALPPPVFPSFLLQQQGHQHAQLGLAAGTTSGGLLNMNFGCNMMHKFGTRNNMPAEQQPPPRAGAPASSQERAEQSQNQGSFQLRKRSSSWCSEPHPESSGSEPVQQPIQGSAVLTPREPPAQEASVNQSVQTLSPPVVEQQQQNFSRSSTGAARNLRAGAAIGAEKGNDAVAGAPGAGTATPPRDNYDASVGPQTACGSGFIKSKKPRSLQPPLLGVATPFAAFTSTSSGPSDHFQDVEHQAANNSMTQMVQRGHQNRLAPVFSVPVPPPMFSTTRGRSPGAGPAHRGLLNTGRFSSGRSNRKYPEPPVPVPIQEEEQPVLNNHGEDTPPAGKDATSAGEEDGDRQQNHASSSLPAPRTSGTTTSHQKILNPGTSTLPRTLQMPGVLQMPSLFGGTANPNANLPNSRGASNPVLPSFVGTVFNNSKTYPTAGFNTIGKNNTGEHQGNNTSSSSSSSSCSNSASSRSESCSRAASSNKKMVVNGKIMDTPSIGSQIGSQQSGDTVTTRYRQIQEEMVLRNPLAFAQKYGAKAAPEPARPWFEDKSRESLQSRLQHLEEERQELVTAFLNHKDEGPLKKPANGIGMNRGTEQVDSSSSPDLESGGNKPVVTRDCVERALELNGSEIMRLKYELNRRDVSQPRERAGDAAAASPLEAQPPFASPMAPGFRSTIESDGDGVRKPVFWNTDKAFLRSPRSPLGGLISTSASTSVGPSTVVTPFAPYCLNAHQHQRPSFTPIPIPASSSCHMAGATTSSGITTAGAQNQASRTVPVAAPPFIHPPQEGKNAGFLQQPRHQQGAGAVATSVRGPPDRGLQRQQNEEEVVYPIREQQIKHDGRNDLPVGAGYHLPAQGGGGSAFISQQDERAEAAYDYSSMEEDEGDLALDEEEFLLAQEVEKQQLSPARKLYNRRQHPQQYEHNKTRPAGPQSDGPLGSPSEEASNDLDVPATILKNALESSEDDSSEVALLTRLQNGEDLGPEEAANGRQILQWKQKLDICRQQSCDDDRQMLNALTTDEFQQQQYVCQLQQQLSAEVEEKRQLRLELETRISAERERSAVEKRRLVGEKRALERRVACEDLEMRRRLAEIESRLMQMTGDRSRLQNDKSTLRASLARSLRNVEQIRQRIVSLSQIEGKTVSALRYLKEETPGDYVEGLISTSCGQQEQREDDMWNKYNQYNPHQHPGTCANQYSKLKPQVFVVGAGAPGNNGQTQHQLQPAGAKYNHAAKINNYAAQQQQPQIISPATMPPSTVLPTPPGQGGIYNFQHTSLTTSPLPPPLVQPVVVKTLQSPLAAAAGGKNNNQAAFFPAQGGGTSSVPRLGVSPQLKFTPGSTAQPATTARAVPGKSASQGVQQVPNFVTSLAPPKIGAVPAGNFPEEQAASGAKKPSIGGPEAPATERTSSQHQQPKLTSATLAKLQRNHSENLLQYNEDNVDTAGSTQQQPRLLVQQNANNNAPQGCSPGNEQGPNSNNYPANEVRRFRTSGEEELSQLDDVLEKAKRLQEKVQRSQMNNSSFFEIEEGEGRNITESEAVGRGAALLGQEEQQDKRFFEEEEGELSRISMEQESIVFDFPPPAQPILESGFRSSEQMDNYACPATAGPRPLREEHEAEPLHLPAIAVGVATLENNSDIKNGHKSCGEDQQELLKAQDNVDAQEPGRDTADDDPPAKLTKVRKRTSQIVKKGPLWNISWQQNKQRNNTDNGLSARPRLSTTSQARSASRSRYGDDSSDGKSDDDSSSPSPALKRKPWQPPSKIHLAAANIKPQVASRHAHLDSTSEEDEEADNRARAALWRTSSANAATTRRAAGADYNSKRGDSSSPTKSLNNFQGGRGGLFSSRAGGAANKITGMNKKNLSSSAISSDWKSTPELQTPDTDDSFKLRRGLRSHNLLRKFNRQISDSS